MSCSFSAEIQNRYVNKRESGSLKRRRAIGKEMVPLSAESWAVRSSKEASRRAEVQKSYK
jgi:hypothetical protein